MISSCELNGRILLKPTVMYLETTYPIHKPLAIRVTIDPQAKSIAWEDTGRGHALEFESYVMDDQKLEVLSSDGSVWTFVPLTLDIFNRIKYQLVRLKVDFKSDTELQAYYSNTDF